MNAASSPRDFSAQPYRAHDVNMVMGRAHRAIGSALVPYTRRPSRPVREGITAVLKAIQFFPMYLNGMSTSGLDGALGDASSAIAALDAAVARDRCTIAGRFAQWLHFRRHPEEYTFLAAAPTMSGKGVGNVIPKLFDWHGPFQVYDPKAASDTDPDILH